MVRTLLWDKCALLPPDELAVYLVMVQRIFGGWRSAWRNDNNVDDDHDDDDDDQRFRRRIPCGFNVVVVFNARKVYQSTGLVRRL